MKLSSLFFVFLLIACQPTKKEESDVLSGGNTEEGDEASSSISVSSSTPKFVFVAHDSNSPAGLPAQVSPALPADGTPVIDSSKLITFSVPTNPADGVNTINYADDGSGSGSNKKISALATSRTHSVTVSESASSCSGPTSSTCTVNTTDDKVLDLTAIDTSSFTSSTSSIPLTVNGVSVTAPVQAHSLGAVGADSPNNNGNQYDYPFINGATFSGDHFYYIGNTVKSGTHYQSLFRVHKTTRVTEPIYNPTQSLVVGGKLQSIMAFNGKVYFGSKPNTYTDFRFLEYDTATGNLRQISSSTQLLNPERFLVHNNSLYFLANNSGEGKRFYKMTTDGTIYQLTNSCGSGSDIGYKYHVTSQGIYMAFSDPSACGNRIIARLKSDDSVSEIAYFAPGFPDSENDGIGAVREYEGKIYISAGTNYILFKDNLDGTLTQLTKYEGVYTGPAPTREFEVTSRGIYWVNQSTPRPYHLNLETGEITAFSTSGWNYQARTILKVGDEVLVRANRGTNRIRYHRLTENFGAVQYVEFNTASNDEIFYLGNYGGEDYYTGRNAVGFKVWKAGKDGVFYQLTNLQSGTNDFSYETGYVYMTTGGFIMSSFGAGKYIFQ